jgi:type IV pilus assembly protein PilB
MSAAKKRIGEILLEAGSITKAQLNEALKAQVSSNNRLGEIFVEKGILTQQQVIEALALQFMMPVVDVKNYLTNISAINSLPRGLMERLGIFPLELQNDGTTLVVAISDPLNLPAQDELRMSTTLNIKLALATEQNIYAALAAIGGGGPGTVPADNKPAEAHSSPVAPPAAPAAHAPVQPSGTPAPGMAAASTPPAAPKTAVTPPAPPVPPVAAAAAPVHSAPEPEAVFTPEDFLPYMGNQTAPAAGGGGFSPLPSLDSLGLGGLKNNNAPLSEPTVEKPQAPIRQEPLHLQPQPQIQPQPAAMTPPPPQTVPFTMPHGGAAPMGASPAAAVAPQTFGMGHTAVATAPSIVPPPVQTGVVSTERGIVPAAAPAAPVPAGGATRDVAVSDAPSKPFLSMMKSQPKLGDILVQAGVITEPQLMEALKKQKLTGKRLGEILVSEGIITEIRLAESLSTQLKLPMFTLTRYRPMPEAIKSVPRHVSERLQLIPLSIVEGDLLLVAMANPLDLLAQDEVRMLTGRDLKIGITTASEIQANLDRLYNLQGNLENAIVEIYGDTELPMEESGIIEAKADDAPVIQLVSNVLDQAVREGASDIHVEPYEKSARIRYRVDGALYTSFDYPVGLHAAVSARMKIMAGMDIAERRKPQDGRILIKVSGRRVDLRVSSLPTLHGEKIVLRILDQENASVGLEKLGLENDDLEKIDVFCGTPWGILLVTGPTGSGKSTTLYSMLEKINQPDVNIVTVEDPVEYTVAGINQVHVNEKAGLSFESALRSILRQDPDKVMVGEIRDQKTASIAIRAALTGHFVLSTLHTNDAPSAATRMVDMGVAPFLVSASLSGVIAQRLVKKLCPFCKEEYEMDPNLCDALRVPHGSHAWKARGCNECRQGYKGRKGIYEIMMVDDDLRKMILEGVSNIQLRTEAIKRGMKTLRQSGINAAMVGLTSIEEVFASTL